MKRSVNKKSQCPRFRVRSLDANLGRGTFARQCLLFFSDPLLSMWTRFRRSLFFALHEVKAAR